METEVSKPISESRVRECYQSAAFWADHIGLYAEQMRKSSDYFAIASALLSTLTGLAVWTTLAASTQWLAVLFVSVVALVAAAVSVIPQIKNFGKCAEDAARLGPKYGHVKGDLLDVLDMFDKNNPKVLSYANEAVVEFEQVKGEKDALKPSPEKLKKIINDWRGKHGNEAVYQAPNQ